MVSPLDLERHHLGELDDKRASLVDAALASDPELAAKFSAFKASDTALLEAHPPALVAAEISRRHRAQEREDEQRRATRWRNWSFGGGSLAVACAAAFLIFVGVPSNVDDGIRAKGDAIGLYIERQAGKTGAAIAGERIQLRVIPGVSKYVAVFSIDGRGVVTRHFPLGDGDGRVSNATKEKEGAAKSGRAFNLPTSLELDDAPLFERFFVVGSQSSLSFALLEQRFAVVARSSNPQTHPVAVDSAWVIHERLLLKAKPSTR